MEVWGDSETQYGQSEKCIVSFSPRSGDRTPQYSRDDIQNTHSIFAFNKHQIHIMNIISDIIP